MMFKDAYRKKNDEIHVRDSLLEDIKAERVERVRSEEKKKDHRKQWLVAIPTFAAAAVACVAIIVGINTSKKSSASPMAVNGMEAEAVACPEEQMNSDAFETDTSLTVSSYEELGRIMQKRDSRSGRRYYGVENADGAMIEEAAPTDAEPAEVPSAVMGSTATVQFDAAKNAGAATGAEIEYSGTNNQVAGVDEADIVKTDGTWIYALNRSQEKVYILAADGKNTKVLSAIKLKTSFEQETGWRYYNEMMLCGDRLYLFGVQYQWSEKIRDEDTTNTFAEVYDLGDRTAPKSIAVHKQQGAYRTARLIDDVLVIVSDYQIYRCYIENDFKKSEEYSPKVTTNSETVTLVPSDIYVNPASDENGFTVVTTIRATDGTEFDSHKAVLGGCSNVYCSGTDLLIASDEWFSEQSEEQTDENGKHFVKIVSGTNTNLFRFTITDGKIDAVAGTKLPGALLNQFSMDAYNGYYRFVVTRTDNEETIWTDGIDSYEWKSAGDCALYVLDGDLNTVGKIEDLAKDERIQSVRFMGDTAYFVTFRQVDPLFAADLSDPKNPKVLSALKIPGFSAYLHPFGEGKLLGIGYDADEEHGWTENVKLSMFDISDPADVREAFKLSVKDMNYTSVQYNHKIVFVDVKSGTVAFPADGMYLVFRADEKGFTEIGRIETADDSWLGDARGLFIKDVFYVIGEREVYILSFETMEKLATIKLK